MSARRWAGGLAALVLVLSGCTRLSPVFRPAPWDGYGDARPFAVRGAGRDTPGPTIFRALRREPKLTAVLERYGEPDTVEVNGGRWSPKQFVLVYRRAGRRLIVDSTPDGLIARVPEVLPGRGRRVGGGGRAAPGGTTDAERSTPAPTMMQTLDCPIDPERPDCQALCASGAKHEWCP